MPMRIVSKIDSVVACGVRRLQAAAHWTRGDTARRVCRYLSVVAAAPAVIHILPLYAAISVLIGYVVLTLMVGDEQSTMIGLTALLRLLVLAAGATAAVMFMLAPTVIGASVAATASIWVFETYAQDI